MQEVDYQKNKLRSNLEQLKVRASENNLLSSVVKEYEAFQTVIEEKDKKHTAELDFINVYIQDIIDTNELTESGLNKLTRENDKILQRMENIKSSIII